MESAGIEEKQQHRPAETGRCVPVDIVREILDRLPLKSLARFACACKLWSSLIDSIIRRRLVDEIHGRFIRCAEIGKRFTAQHDPLEVLLGDADGLPARRDRLKGMLDEMVPFVAFPDDMAGYVDRIQELRDLVESLRHLVGRLADNIGRVIVVLDRLGRMQQEAAADIDSVN